MTRTWKLEASRINHVRRTRPANRFASFAAPLWLLIIGSGWSLNARSCNCQERLCENLRVMYGRLAGDYDDCCGGPAGEQDDCIRGIVDRADETIDLALQAKIACDEGNDELVKQIMQQIFDLWHPKLSTLATGQVVNEIPVLGGRDWLEIDATLPRDPESCAPVTVSVINGKVVNAASTGAAAENATEQDPAGGGSDLALVLPANGGQTYNACSYRIPAGTTFNMRFGTQVNNITLSGLISVAPLTQTFPAQGVADVGLPSDVALTATSFGQTVKLALDKTCPFNTLKADSTGHGKLCVALKLSTASPIAAGYPQLYTPIYFELPVAVSAEWTSIRITADPEIPGDAITPTDPIVLAGADHAGSPPIDADRCGDADGNGIRDGADRFIKAMDTYMHCVSDAEH